MGLAYIRPINPPGELALVEVIDLAPGSAPPRPTPRPPGNWSPEVPTHPIVNPWPPYVDIGLPMPQPPVEIEPPIHAAQPPQAGQLPQSDPQGWMYVYSPQYDKWLWVYVGPTEPEPKST